MARISREEVERVAALARLALTDDEAERMTRDLETLLEYVEALRGLDTTGVAPTSQVVPVPTPLREDRPTGGLDPELALGNAPERDGFSFAVPKVIAEDET